MKVRILVMISLFVLTMILTGCGGGAESAPEMTTSTCRSQPTCYFDCIMEKERYACGPSQIKDADDGKDNCDLRNLRSGENCHEYLISLFVATGSGGMIVDVPYVCKTRSECYYHCIWNYDETDPDKCNELEKLTGEQAQTICEDEEIPLQNNEECYDYLLEEEHPPALIPILTD